LSNQVEPMLSYRFHKSPLALRTNLRWLFLLYVACILESCVPFITAFTVAPELLNTTAVESKFAS
ncbi:MAG: hypothetical protein ABIJ40_06460, partial [Bacteroidota bacterium]